MSDPEDIDSTAAEYALGTLDLAERIAVAARRQREPALAAAIEAWELRFGPLGETVPSVAPSAELWAGIEARIMGVSTAPVAMALRVAAPIDPHAAEAARKILLLNRRVGRWRTRAIGFAAMAAALLVGLGLREQSRPGVAKSYVAVLQKDAASPAFLLSVDLEAHAFTIRPVSAQPQPGKSFELWLVDSKLGAKSLGVIGDQPATARDKLPFDKVTLAGATYAVTAEPAGGSPTGAPTGPVLFSGQLIAATP